MKVSARLAIATVVAAAPSAAFVVPQASTNPPVSATDLRALGRSKGDGDAMAMVRNAAVASIVSFSLLADPMTASADGQTEKFRLPPIDFSDKNRCVFNSSTIGQANAARDKLYDLRQCSLSGANAVGFDLSGVLMTGTDVSNANFQDAYFSKGYLHDSKFDGADFTNAIVDRASFKGSSLRGAIFNNALLTGTSFENADVEGADFSEAYIGNYDIKALCKNPTLKGENPKTGADTRMSVGCGP